MKKSLKRTLAIFMTIVMLLTAFPLSVGMVTASAADYAGDVVEFGTYPQSAVTDEALLSQLNGLALTWTSYNYYYGEDTAGTMKTGDYMMYSDVLFDNQQYRAVKFTSYRPRMSFYPNSKTNQIANGYADTDYIYWFKFEPIKWKVLDPKSGLILCESAIDSQAYNNNIYAIDIDKDNKISGSEYYGDEDAVHFANDYSVSSIREWLNNDFYNTAFSDEQKAAVNVSILDNSAIEGYDDYSSADTHDKVFLPSYSDVTNVEYGFSDKTVADETRKSIPSDYAKSQGVSVEAESNPGGNPDWLLRSGGMQANYAIGVNLSGSFYDRFTYRTDSGIRPAAAVDLTKVTFVQHNLTHTPAVAATCQTGGNVEYWYCKNCDKFFSDEACTEELTSVTTKSLGHFWNNGVVTTQPTCTTEGVRTYTCTGEGCNATYTESVARKADAHNWDEGVITTPATCTQQGLKTYTCIYDSSHTRTEVVDATGHSAVRHDAKPATCTADGNTLYWYCPGCNTCYSDAACTNTISLDKVTLHATGHKNVEKIEKISATCENSGNYDYWHCKDCGKYYSDSNCVTEESLTDTVIPATGHSFTAEEADDIFLKTAATCTEKAVYYKSCVNCGISSEGTAGEETFESGKENGHSYTSYVYNNDATCTENGTETAKCDNCDETDTRTKANSALGHDFTKEVVADEFVKSDATCTEKAVYYKSCVNCGISSKGTADEATFESGKEKGHSYTSYVYNNDATCTEDGTETAKCDRCDETDTRTKVNSALGHAFTREEVAQEYLKASATCTTKAVYYKSCAVCKISSKGEAGEATFEHGEVLNHNYVGVITTPSTCTEKGVETFTCTNDNTHTYTQEVAINPDNHVNTEKLKALQPGKESEGSDEGTFCKDCKRYFDSVGTPVTGYRIINDSIYYFAADGKRFENGEYDGNTYSADGKLSLNNGFVKINGNTYYLVDSVIIKGYKAIERRIYRFDEFGVMYRGKYDGYTFDENGQMTGTRFVEINDETYYIVNGNVVTGYYTINSHIYKFDETGIMLSQGEHLYETVVVKPTCVEGGYTVYTCACGDTYRGNFTDALGHIDENKDYFCDRCKEKLSDLSDSCDCLCHKTGAMKIVYILFLFIWRLFDTNQTCACGVAHY